MTKEEKRNRIYSELIDGTINLPEETIGYVVNSLTEEPGLPQDNYEIAVEDLMSEAVDALEYSIKESVKRMLDLYLKDMAIAVVPDNYETTDDFTGFVQGGKHFVSVGAKHRGEFEPGDMVLSSSGQLVSWDAHDTSDGVLVFRQVEF